MRHCSECREDVETEIIIQHVAIVRHSYERCIFCETVLAIDGTPTEKPVDT